MGRPRKDPFLNARFEKTRKEAWLRQWIKHGWDERVRGPLSWVEPSLGSSVGMPDLLLPIDGLWLPVELKAATVPRKDYTFLQRASQFRFHTLAVKHNLKSAYLVVCTDDIFAFPSSKHLRKGEKVKGFSVLTVDHMVRLFRSNLFWSLRE